MTGRREDQISLAGIPADDAIDVLRAEPALAWFLAQGLWLTQPVLEIFWPREQIAQVAEVLESVRRPALPRRLERGDREEHTGS
jgi:hypothetical protein